MVTLDISFSIVLSEEGILADPVEREKDFKIATEVVKGSLKEAFTLSDDEVDSIKIEFKGVPNV